MNFFAVCVHGAGLSAKVAGGTRVTEGNEADYKDVVSNLVKIISSNFPLQFIQTDHVQNSTFLT